MNKTKKILFGDNLLKEDKLSVKGEIVEREGEKFYRITNYDEMSPFFLSVVSNSDHWMFLSSLGGLTCGRKSPENALFPYYTDDKIHDGSYNTGPKTILLVGDGTTKKLWEPFNLQYPQVYSVLRNLYKSTIGNKIIFEEINHTLDLCFCYTWMSSDKFGFIRKSELFNLDKKNVQHVEILDGLQNVLPYGVNKMLQANMSTLVDGYKKCELHSKSGVGIYTLSSILTDRAEPSEALKATTIFSVGLKSPKYLLSTKQISQFRRGLPIKEEYVLKGMRGAYFVHDCKDIESNDLLEWFLVADINQGPSDVPLLIHQVESKLITKSELIREVRNDSKELENLVAKSDGIQYTQDDLRNSRHFSNTMFNIMRGGLFPNNYNIDTDDFVQFVRTWNLVLFEKFKDFFDQSLKKGSINYFELLETVRAFKDDSFLRLIYEYLPITFSRRHGDPSRPWNHFSIDIKNQDGSQNFSYQGNWRDIFQNWEALSISYPGFIESFISKFVNASTIDGYNPYRVTRDGIDWEILDPDDPWSNIGYWGDHQIIYLLKLLELSLKFNPGKIQQLFSSDIFAYANVPYKIKAYKDILEDVQDTIVYDEKLAKEIGIREKQLGADGKLVYLSDGNIYQVNLIEKLLVTLLAKLTNFVPEGGIWMNTQRPEWNDANNALVGNGLSMVTLYYLRRFLNEFRELLDNSKESGFQVSKEVTVLFYQVLKIFRNNESSLAAQIGDIQRRLIVNELGEAGSFYRLSIYNHGFSGSREQLKALEISDFVNLSIKYLDHSIRANKRNNGLFHAYNLIHFQEGKCKISNLHEMLEGQVAVLSSKFLSAKEGLEILDSLRKSKMYREDQNSYTLYPDRQLPDFLDKNVLTEGVVKQSIFLQNQLKNGEKSIIEVDLNNRYHFNGTIRNSTELRERLQKINDLPKAEQDIVCDIYETCFNHKQFTGRSGTFFKYEGLGCIYWHMVSKLHLAVQELYFDAIKQNTDEKTLIGIKDHYLQIKDGLGLKKSPDNYGAFPIDAYSHTPGFTGVQQPGMTGQVKEDILIRFGELGVIVENGEIYFEPILLEKSEYFSQPVTWYFNNNKIELKQGELAYSFCGIPVIYSKNIKKGILLTLNDGTTKEFPDTYRLSQEIAFDVFGRTGKIEIIFVGF